MTFSFLHKLFLLTRARPLIGGLEISDTSIRFTRFDGKRWQLVAQKLPPGIVERGQVKNHEELVKILKAVRADILRRPASRKKINVVVCLSSAPVYAQMFDLPMLSGPSLDQAALLNMEMALPSDISQNYFGWQKVGEDRTNGRLEILGAFIDRTIADQFSTVIYESGFSPVASEFRALALARFARQQGVGYDEKNSYLMLELSPGGLDFSIVRHGELYFEYFNPWSDVQGDRRQITIPEFEAVIVRNFHQMFNFYSQHWNDRIAEVFLVAGGLTDETARIVKDNFDLKSRKLEMREGTSSIDAEWFVALGSGLRALRSTSEDTEINLLSAEAKNEIRRIHLTYFLHFWRVVLPLAFGVLLAAFAGVSLFLTRTAASLKAQSILSSSRGDVGEVDRLEQKVRVFNRSVGILSAVEELITKKGSALEAVRTLAAKNRITISRFYLQDDHRPALLTGKAKTNDALVLFKRGIEEDGHFADVTLPLSEVRTGPDGFSFSMSFLLALE